MGKRLSGIMILTIFSLIIMNTLALAVPMTINYQGKLTDPNGSVLNGEYQMSFSLFDTDTNGTALWSEQQTVAVINGIYNVELGVVNPLTASIFNNENLYLEVGIESEILLPRQKLTSVAFAIRAQEADTANYSETAGDANTLNGKNSAEFGDTHSLDAADGDPVDAVYVDNNGNVGIGTTSPLDDLHISDSGTNRATLFIGATGTGEASIYLDASNGDFVGSDYFEIWQSDDLKGHINVRPSGSDLALQENGGNVGIGTTEPEYALHIFKSGNTGMMIESSSSGYPTHGSTSNSGILFGNPDHEWYIGGDYHNTMLKIDYDGQNRILIDSNGNIGIGTMSPEGKLDVNGSIYQRGSQLYADYVFEPDYKLESIKEHSKYMWENKHLKAIPNARVDKDGQEIIEVGAHRKGIVEELEKAHIYIEQLHKQNIELEKRLTKLEENLTRLKASSDIKQ